MGTVRVSTTSYACRACHRAVADKRPIRASTGFERGVNPIFMLLRARSIGDRAVGSFWRVSVGVGELTVRDQGRVAVHNLGIEAAGGPEGREDLLRAFTGDREVDRVVCAFGRRTSFGTCIGSLTDAGRLGLTNICDRTGVLRSGRAFVIFLERLGSLSEARSIVGTTRTLSHGTYRRAVRPVLVAVKQGWVARPTFFINQAGAVTSSRGWWT